MKRWIAMICFIFLWGYGLVQMVSLRSCRGQVFLYYGDGEGITAGQITDEMRQEKEMTAWSVLPDVEVRNMELGRTAAADCMVVYGAKEMASCRGLVTGTYGYRTDKEGCVISEGLAMELFGSVSVTGMKLWCRDKAYMVRGVTDDRSRVIMVLAENDEILCYMLLDCREDEDGRTEAENFLYKYGIGSGDALVDGSLLFAAAGFGAVAPLWLVSLWICCAVQRKRPGRREKLWLYGAAGTVFLAGIGLIWGMELEFPPYLIPTRWSDFGFWSARFREIRSDLERLNEAGRVQWLAQAKGKLLRIYSLSFISFWGFSTLIHMTAVHLW